jgi:hypothetical protein
MSSGLPLLSPFALYYKEIGFPLGATNFSLRILLFNRGHPIAFLKVLYLARTHPDEALLSCSRIYLLVFEKYPRHFTWRLVIEHIQAGPKTRNVASVN